jgi:hypothetical protein
VIPIIVGGADGNSVGIGGFNHASSIVVFPSLSGSIGKDGGNPAFGIVLVAGLLTDGVDDLCDISKAVMGVPGGVAFRVGGADKAFLVVVFVGPDRAVGCGSAYEIAVFVITIEGGTAEGISGRCAVAIGVVGMASDTAERIGNCDEVASFVIRAL